MSYFWVCGCIRSGTNFICRAFAPYVDAVMAEDTTKINSYRSRALPARKALVNSYDSFAFKVCEDFRQMDELYKLTDKSFFVFVVRDGREVVQSIATPNRSSLPFRRFPRVKQLSKITGDDFVSAIQIWMEYMNDFTEALESGSYTGCKMLINYNKFMTDHGEQAKIADLFDQPVQLPEAIRSTPNSNAWESWSTEQKSKFKAYPRANDMLIRYGYVEDDCW